MLDLDTIEKRAKQATPGPWRRDDRGAFRTTIADELDSYPQVVATSAYPGQEGMVFCSPTDAAFIEGAVVDSLALVAAAHSKSITARRRCTSARAAANGIEPMAESVDDLLCDLKKRAAQAERAMVGLDPNTSEPT